MGALLEAQLGRISQMDSGSTLHLTNRPSRVTDGLIARSLLQSPFALRPSLCRCSGCGERGQKVASRRCQILRLHWRNCGKSQNCRGRLVARVTV